MKKHLFIAMLAVLTLSASVAVGCGGNSTTPESTSQTTEDTSKDTGSTDDTSKDTGSEEDTSKDTDITITGVTYSNATFDYDGTEKTLTVTGELPTGVTATYETNKGTDAGTYNAKATLSGEGYKTLVLNATLTINKIDITGVTYSNATFDYDGTEKTVTVTGELPTGVTATYTTNKGTDAGTYNAKVNLSGKNYNTKNLTATLTINKIDIPGELTFTDDSVEYDALSHALAVVGNVPAGVTVSYTYNGNKTDSVTEVGSYTVIATLSGKNYNTKTFTATLNITTTEETLYSAVVGGKVYFQNNLDGNKLYTYNGTSAQKINNDIPNYLTAYGNTLYYYSSSLFSKTIKGYTSGTANTIYSVGGEYLTTDGTYIYYAVNNLLFKTEDNGIYKANLNGNETPVRITKDKAEYLTYYGNKIYYSNKDDGGKLYAISTSVANGTGTKLHDEKVEYIIEDNGNLYFNSSKTLSVVTTASAVYRYSVASGTAIKLTTDSGKYLTKIGDYVYYINNDKLTSKLFGDGIYRVSASKTSDSSMPGEKVISATGNGYSSLSGDGTYLYYYKLNDKHFYRYTVSSGTEKDLMEGFVPVEDTTLTGYSHLAEYNGEIYYTNPLDSGCLYKYNLQTKANFKVISDPTSGVWFNDGYMYYSTYFLTNYALFRTKLATGETDKINTDRCDNLIFDGNKIYFVKVGSVYNNHICVMDLDGQNVVELEKDDNLWVADMVKVGDYIYYTRNPKLYAKRLSKLNVNTKQITIVNDDIKALTFTMTDSKIFVYGTDNTLYSLNLDGTGKTTIATNVEINDMVVMNGILYYSSTSTQNKGLFAYNVAKNTTTKVASTNADAMYVKDGVLYFLQSAVSYTNDYPTQETGNNGHLYSYDGTTVKKLA